jgi:hypothetical protein
MRSTCWPVIALLLAMASFAHAEPSIRVLCRDGEDTMVRKPVGGRLAVAICDGGPACDDSCEFQLGLTNPCVECEPDDESPVVTTLDLEGKRRVSARVEAFDTSFKLVCRRARRSSDCPR